ncbi:MAG: hypothetical protein WAM60_04125, partial [Candidatus Promineifilaceae bacterium]
MLVKSPSTHKFRRIQFMAAFILSAVFLLALVTLALAERGTVKAPESPLQSGFFSLNGTLTPGESISPVFPLASSQRPFNFSLGATGGGPLALSMTNGSGGGIWSGSAQQGETLWGNGTLTNGNNTFILTNNGGTPLNFALELFDIPQTPYTWSGSAAPSGLNSAAHISFPTSGLYTIGFSVNSGGRYQFSLDGTHIQKSIDANASATFYVPAGVHSLLVVQDTTGGQVDWSIDLTYTGSTSDTLPYAAIGVNISEEWLPIFLDSTAEVNILTAVSGSPGDYLTMDVVSPSFSPPVASTIYTGESHWMTLDMPAGLSYIHVTANGGYLDYDLTLDTLPSTDYTWNGVADPGGENSQARVKFSADGLYRFDFGVGGSERYQFLADVGGDNYIQQTIEASSVITSFVPTGTHDLTLVQDTTTGADWQVAITFLGAGNTPLPYSKGGGILGGSGNDFDEEWLPIASAAGGTVNMSFEASGVDSDSFAIEIYQAGSGTPDYVVPQVLGTETLWATFDLSAGVNLVHVSADSGNGSPMSYEMTVDDLPGSGTAAWEGTSLSAGSNSAFSVDFPTTGLYRFDIESTSGFANLVLDDNVGPHPSNFGPESTTYDIMVDAGQHEINTMQDSAYPITEWSASVQPVTAATSFFTFEGNLDSGDTVVPQFPVDLSSLPFNFSLSVSGSGPVHLMMKDGSAGTIWDGSALTGETVWGTGNLTSGNNTFSITNNGGSSADVTLILYTIPTVPYSWSGISGAAGENSNAQLTFATGGLYTFNLDVTNGRYQFFLDDEYIQKTAESDTSVTYYVPAGTHDLTVVQDTGSGAAWTVDMTGPGPAN